MRGIGNRKEIDTLNVVVDENVSFGVVSYLKIEIVEAKEDELLILRSFSHFDISSTVLFSNVYASKTSDPGADGFFLPTI